MLLSCSRLTRSSSNEITSTLRTCFRLTGVMEDVTAMPSKDSGMK